MSERPIRVRIESDGTLSGSRIVDAESGRPIACTSATWTIDAAGPAVLTIVLLDFELAAEGIVTKSRRETDAASKRDAGSVGNQTHEPDDDCLHCGRVPIDHVCTWKDGF